MDELEQHVRGDAQTLLDGRAPGPGQAQDGSPEDKCDDQHLQQLAAGEGADEVVGKDVEDEVRRVREGAPCDGRAGCDGRQWRVPPDAQHMTGDQAEDDCHGGDQLEIHQRHHAELADPAEVAGRHDPGGHAQEHQRRDGGADQAQEDVAQDLARQRDRGRQQPECDAEHHRQPDLGAQAAPRRALAGDGGGAHRPVRSADPSTRSTMAGAAPK